MWDPETQRLLNNMSQEEYEEWKREHHKNLIHYPDGRVFNIDTARFEKEEE